MKATHALLTDSPELALTGPGGLGSAGNADHLHTLLPATGTSVAFMFFLKIYVCVFYSMPSTVSIHYLGLNKIFKQTISKKHMTKLTYTST